MKSDLRNLVTAQESYFADTDLYGSVTNLANYYNASAGVTVVATPTTGISHKATATHSGTVQTCAIYINEAFAAPATSEGAPGCA